MAEVKDVDIFSASPKDAIVITTNCVGVAGKGLALEFKKRFPREHEEYVSICKSGKVKPGDVIRLKQHKENPKILCAMTKDHWRNGSSYEWVTLCCMELKDISEYERGFERLYVPALGCSLGGLRWYVVEQIIQAFFRNDITTIVIPPNDQVR